jgi:predicted transcriptional regulator
MEDLMALVKEEVIRMIQNMPQDASIEDIMAELYFRYQVDEGLKQLDEGKGIPHEDVEKRIERWIKK